MPDSETSQQQLEWLFNTGMNNCDVIPDWVWMAACASFEAQHKLPSGFISTKNFPGLSHKNSPVPTLEDVLKLANARQPQTA